MIPPPSGPTVYAAAVLRVTPDVLPELRRAVDTTLDELTPHLKLMQHGAYLPEPWLGDPVSLKSYQVYNDHVMGARDGPVHAQLAYEEQLRLNSQRLTEIQRNYDEAEAATTDLVQKMT